MALCVTFHKASNGMPHDRPHLLPRIVSAALKRLVRGVTIVLGLRRLEDIRLDHDAAPLEVDRHTVVVNINRTWYPEIDDAMLWQISRKWWTSGGKSCRPDKRRPRPTLLLAVGRNIVRGAWLLDPGQLGREHSPTWDELGPIWQRIFYNNDPSKFAPFNGWVFDATPMNAAAAARYIGRSFKFQPQGTVRYLP
jgi:hypothetical protein